MLLESLSLDSEELRLSLASSPQNLSLILDFVERAAPPTYWEACTSNVKERKRWEATVGTCKAAVIKCVVTVAGEDKNLTTLWDPKNGEGFPGGWFVKRMVGWIKETKLEERDDLIICGTLSLGNLARKCKHFALCRNVPTLLTETPFSIALCRTLNPADFIGTEPPPTPRPESGPEGETWNDWSP